MSLEIEATPSALRITLLLGIVHSLSPETLVASHSTEFHVLFDGIIPEARKQMAEGEDEPSRLTAVSILEAALQSLNKALQASRQGNQYVLHVEHPLSQLQLVRACSFMTEGNGGGDDPYFHELISLPRFSKEVLGSFLPCWAELGNQVGNQYFNAAFNEMVQLFKKKGEGESFLEECFAYFHYQACLHG